MFTYFDDPEISHFIRSMPWLSRADFVIRAMGVWYFHFASSLYCIQFLLFPIALKFCGAWSLVLVVPLTVVGITALVVFKNWKLRKSIRAMLVDGKFQYCPACSLPQICNDTKRCDCGCLIRPFVPMAELVEPPRLEMEMMFCFKSD